MAPPRQSTGSLPRDVVSVPADGRVSQDVPRSLPRFEGFASTLGGFARSPQVSRTPTRFLPRHDEPRMSEAGPQSNSAFVRSLQTPLLHQDAIATSSSYRQSLPSQPASLLARSIGSLTEVFNRQACKFSFAVQLLWPSERPLRIRAASSRGR